MRLTLTVHTSGQARDVALESAADASVGAVAEALGGTDLWLGAGQLDRTLPLALAGLRHGDAVGVDAPGPTRAVEPEGVVELRVTGGPGAGRVLRLEVGEYDLGGGGADVRLEGVPERCARLHVGPDGQVAVEPAVVGRSHPAPTRTRPLEGPVVLSEGEVDAATDLPLLHLERQEVVGRRRWPHGRQLAVGPVLLEVHPVGPADAPLTPTPGEATLDLNRPPRLLPARRVTAFTLPAEPKRPDRAPLPLAMMAVPVVMGVVLYLVTRSAYSLLFLAMSPLMALAGWSTGARQQRRRYRAERREHARRTTKVHEAARGALLAERSARRAGFPDPAAVLVTATGPRSRLWERRRTDPDFLVARIGTADQPSEVTLQDPARESHEGALTWTAPDVPATVALDEVGVTGIAGPARHGLARWVLAQTAVLHPPGDVRVVVLAEDDSRTDWRWLRWLPHTSVGETAVADLLALVDAEGNNPGNVLVVLDGAQRLRLQPGVADLLRRGPAAGVHLLCLDAEERLLPEECRAVVTTSGPDTTLSRTGAPTVEGVRVEGVGVSWAERVARSLAPVRDGADPTGERLPRSVRLPDLLDCPATPDAILESWARSPRSTSAVLGVAEDGPFVVDLVRDGPHALVAGTTGAGKSELLQTLIASLALANRPDELSFVLVDYKGGAAFAECRDLPHTAGLVTDLDGHLTTRALDSLGAELRRREERLARAGAKDLEAYLDARGPEDEPLPRLVIVIDEFAALVAELPDFVTGLVDLARRGRSLGVHLVLATQRPAGVVSAEVRANTALRIALRVTDAADSRDVVEVDAAAGITASAPGRAYARLGTDVPVLFQAARVGGTAPAADGPVVRVAPMEAPAAAAPAPGAADGPSDLARLVAALQVAASGADVRLPARPWLPALPETVTLDELTPPTAFALPFGLADVPARQRRESAVLDLAAGRHLGVLGGPRSGRSTVLRTVAGAIGRWTSPEDVHVHAVDCGANALLPLVCLPHVGVVVTRDQPDRMTRLVDRLRRLVAERQQALATAGFADVTEQRAAVGPADRMAFVVVLIDRWEGLVAAYDSVDGGALVIAWQQLMQEGGAVGLTVVVTGDRTLGVGRMAALIDDRLLLRMPEPGDYAGIGLPAKQVPSAMAPGRGFRAAGARETQVALLDAEPAGTAQVAALQRTGREAAARWADVPAGRRALRLDVLPVRIGLAQAERLGAGTDTDLVLGVGGDALGLRGLDPVRHGPALLVTGPRHSGRSTALRTLATFALRRGWEAVVVTPRTSPLRSLCDEPGVHGPVDADSDPTEVAELLAKLRDADAPSLTLVDDVELLGVDGWLPDLLERHLQELRDSGSVLAAAGSPAELGPVYRGPVVALKRSGSGLMLSPQSSTDADLYGARLPRSALGQVLPPGAGYLVRSGRPERVQVVWPE